MKARHVLGLSVAVPALVVTFAQPGVAAQTRAVAFAGTIEITPTASGQPQTLDVCFFATACVNGGEPSGFADGVSVDSADLSVDRVDGLEAEATFSEPCTAAGTLAPSTMAVLRGRFHGVAKGWGGYVVAQWTRVGTVAVIAGQAYGAATVTPLGTAPCGSPIPVEIAGQVVVPLN